MSIADYTLPAPEVACVPVAGGASGARAPAGRRLHRLREVRRQQGISRRTVARRLKANVSQIKSQEDESSDLLLSTLYQWRGVLQVPVAELLVECDERLSPPVERRAQLVRLMKTGLTILERAQQPGVRSMAQALVDQLIELMPELREVKAWPAVGKRRTLDELGQAAHRGLSRDALAALMDGAR